jgi:hypothetical protein
MLWIYDQFGRKKKVGGGWAVGGWPKPLMFTQFRDIRNGFVESGDQWAVCDSQPIDLLVL